jgi:hypothetical protein
VNAHSATKGVKEMNITKKKRKEFDDLILSCCENWTSLSDLMQWASVINVGIGSFRASVKRLIAAKKLQEQWEGNERYGHNVYRQI